MDDPPYRPWGTVTPAFWHGAPEPEPSRSTPPADAHTRLSEVPALVSAGRTEDASALAEQLDREISAEYGEAHRHTIEVREVRGYLASLTGDHATAVGWYLHAARLRASTQGPNNPETLQATRRAYSLWRTVPERDARRLGSELLVTVTDIHGAESKVARRTRERLSALNEKAPAP